jgi:phosphate starvation-inducible PhoH-like protein
MSNSRYGKRKFNRDDRMERRDYRTYAEGSESRSTRGVQNIYERKMRRLVAKTERQQLYMDCIDASDIVFCMGPAGSGKTHIAVGKAVEFVKANLLDDDKNKKKIILVRPLIEVGKTMGFLPGGIEQKMDPYLRPLFDELHHFFTVSEVKSLQEEERIEIASLEHMRGRTLRNAIVILDEAQNATKEQMKMFLTRLGKGSKLIITGDSEQSDLPVRPVACVYYAEKFEGIEGVSVVRLGRQDIVRHPTVARLVEAGLD